VYDFRCQSETDFHPYGSKAIVTGRQISLSYNKK
jgi:hypothetical protein